MAAGSPSWGPRKMWLTPSALARRAQHWPSMYLLSARERSRTDRDMELVGERQADLGEPGPKCSIARCSHPSRVRPWASVAACCPGSAFPS